jgi:hypothetical protein
MLVIAHAGHWLTMVGPFGPIFAMIGWLIWISVRERRAEGKGNQLG